MEQRLADLCEELGIDAKPGLENLIEGLEVFASDAGHELVVRPYNDAMWCLQSRHSHCGGTEYTTLLMLCVDDARRLAVAGVHDLFGGLKGLPFVAAQSSIKG